MQNPLHFCWHVQDLICNDILAGSLNEVPQLIQGGKLSTTAINPSFDNRLEVLCSIRFKPDKLGGQVISFLPLIPFFSKNCLVHLLVWEGAPPCMRMNPENDRVKFRSHSKWVTDST